VVAVVIGLVTLLFLRPTWQVRNGATEVAESALDSGLVADSHPSIGWSCHEHVATMEPPDGLTVREYGREIGSRLESLGFEPVTGGRYHRERDDDLDYDEVRIEDDDPDILTLAFGVFDIDSALCLPSVLAPAVDSEAPPRSPDGGGPE
jgi:hypothetical protein